MTAVIAGCGALGTAVGLRLAASGHRVVGIRRQAPLLPEGIEGLGVDLSANRPDLPADTEIVVFALTAGDRSAAGYRATYLDGVRNTLDGLPRSADRPAALFVSSTSVYGEKNGGWVDESTPARPATETAAVLLETEQELRSRLPRSVVLRLAGLYGPGRGTLVDRVRAGTATAPLHRTYTNRIHIEDATSAVVHLLTRVRHPEPLYIGADNEPVDRAELLQFLADRLQVPRPPVASAGTREAGKRCRNDRLLATGLTLRFPSYREGYASLLTDRR